MKAMAKELQDRFPSARTFAEALESASKKPSDRIGPANYIQQKPSIGTTLLVYRGHNDAPGYACAWSPDGTRLLTGGRNGLVKVWNPVTGDPILTCEDHSVAPINAVAWSPDGTRLASASHDKKVWIWDANNGRPLHTYSDHIAPVITVAWSPDSSSLASTSASDDDIVQVWDANRSKLMAHASPQEHSMGWW